MERRKWRPRVVGVSTEEQPLDVHLEALSEKGRFTDKGQVER